MAFEVDSREALRYFNPRYFQRSAMREKSVFESSGRD